MDGQDGRARSPSIGAQYSQPSGVNMPASSASFSNAYDAGISPTSNGEQFGFTNQNSYMHNLNAPTFQQPGLSDDYQNPSDNAFMIDPSLQAASQAQTGSINPAALMGNTSPSHQSPAHSPSIPQGGHFYSPNHSRNASLDPSSAANMPHQQGQEWSGMLNRPSFQNHRRAPSEHSDISSLSPSPYVKQDSFEYDASRSPMLGAQHDSGVYPENLGIDRFSISDAQQQQHQAAVSPRVSPYPSPRMSPQPGLGIPENSFILPSNDGHRMGPPVFNQGGGGVDMSNQMAPPEINVEFAPPSKQNMDMMRDAGFDGLSPPSRGRPRAHSDPSFPQMSRPLSAGDTSPSLLGVEAKQRQRSLSPLDVSGSSSRDPSPHRAGSRRSSTPSIPNRDYILDLADPTRPTASGDGQRARVQKHPATFQCNLCPKRFTRAYNLRSHLRTHTDERPFVCTVCNKAFARQHDRKRHEGLHSGEKKFVCKGDLAQPGQTWGCGRRFARADALGRHFRSEAGRVCIKPLLDEEATERQRQFEERMMASGQGMHQGMQPQMQPMMENGGFALPQALLAQYPALQGIQWDQLGPGGPEEGDGRSSFDASSGGEFYDDEDPNGGYVSGPGTAYAAAWG